MRFAAPRGISGPGLRQIQLMGDRETGVMIGDRQRHRRLAVGLLAELSAILMVHAHRMVALLGIGCVVDDPRLDRLAVLNHRHHQLAYFHQYPRVRPIGFADKMQQPLMLHRYLGRRRQRRHRFDTAPSFARQQARAIVVQRRHPTNMTDHARQFADISRKTLDPINDSRKIHPRSSRSR